MRAKKSFGQNFLKSKVIISDIIKTADISNDDAVLEIGPGRGDLTESLLAKARVVVAVEKDHELIEILEKKFTKEIELKKLILFCGDVLDFNISENKSLRDGYKIVANIPYYITGVFLRKIFEECIKPDSIILMLQKEVAKRIVARDGKESILSISVKTYGTPHYIKKVSASYFSPKPKVDSAILQITKINSPFKNSTQERCFFDLVHSGFAHKRKLLKNNLSHANYIDIEKSFALCEIKPNARAEDLSIKQWFCLAKKLK